MRTVLLWVRDNLDLLKELVQNEAETLDLIYIDPPFNSKRNYNMVFGESDATEQAFTDIWSNYKYKDELEEIGTINVNLYNFLVNLEKGGLPASYLSYLTMMGIRCWYMHKMLKPTGSFYYHCDPTCGHYIKILLDYIFGMKNFRNEIVWRYSKMASSSKKFIENHDIIFFYSKSDDLTYKQQYVAAESALKERLRKYIHNDVIIYKDIKNNNSILIEKYKNSARNRKGAELEDEDIIIDFSHKGRQKVDDVWEIPIIKGNSKERLGYPTQKPEALLERIILASSNPGDKVADFYLGGGTTAAVAVRNGREFLGCDINLRAIQITQKRLEALGMQFGKDLIVKGVPFSTKELKEYLQYIAENSDKKNVEKFELETITTKYYLKGVVGNEKKVGDKGVDGTFGFKYQGQNRKGIVQITSSSNLNHFKAFQSEVLKGTGDIGVYICFEAHVNDNMRKLAKECGRLGNVDRLQILTFEQLLDKKQYFQIPSEEFVLS